MTGVELGAIVGAVGGLTSFVVAVRSVFTARAERRRTGAEATNTETDTALKPLQAALMAQGELIDDLTERIKELQKQIVDERAEHASKIAELRAEIADLRAQLAA